ncbi:MAG: prohibitin family protein [Crocinitomicaceae bacterium]
MKIANLKSTTAICFTIALTTACTVIRPGQVGLKQRYGKLSAPLGNGAHGYNPFSTHIVKINVQTVELYESLPLPTKEGLNVDAQITLLYHVDPEKAKEVYTNFGRGYEKVMVESNFLATAREVSSKYFAKELYAIERQKVEKLIKDELIEHISSKGFIIDAVLLKDIILPASMSKAIQDKVNSEQAVLQMDFVIQKQHKEAERLIIEAEGIKKAQKIIDSSLTDNLLRYNQIEVMKNLVTSPNAKVIITNTGTSTSGSGNSPLIIN